MANQDPATSTPATQWKEVSEPETDEIKFSFDVLGDQFIGTFLGQRTQENENGKYIQYRFEGQDGNLYFINGNFNLQNGMKGVRIRNLVRITFTGEKDTGQATPMRLFKVEVGRAPIPATK